MHTNEYLFPHRYPRRDFIKTGALAMAGLSLAGSVHAQEKKAPVRIGSSKWTYTLDEEWGTLPAGMKYGFGCGVIVDSKDRAYVTSRSANPCVAVFDRNGKLLETWSQDFADRVGFTTEQVKDTAHCLYLSKEGREEFIYWTENVSTNKEGPKLGKRVYKTDLKGKILYVIGNVAKEGSTAQKFDWTNPTDVAVAPNRDIYVVDGYGSQRVSRFDKEFKHLRTIGQRTEKGKTGPDAAHGTFNTCHGLGSTRSSRSRKSISRTATTIVSRCSIWNSIISARSKATCVIRAVSISTRGTFTFPTSPAASRSSTPMTSSSRTWATDARPMGKPRPDNSRNRELFTAPHAMCVDSHGDLYVVEWVDFGRARKFNHTPMA